MKKEKKIALQRIRILYKKALEIYDENPELARRYIYLLWKLKLKYRITLPKNIKFCKRCFTPWIIGKTIRIRIRKGRRIVTCLNCGLVKRFKYKS